jgi:mannose-6-phosphate isomerase-like protein (cupin superfamily)
MSGEIRRVVTTHDKTGKAIVLFDSDNPHKVVRPVGNFVSRVIWRTDTAPAVMDTHEDVGGAQKGVSPPPSGTVFRIVDFPPMSPELEKLDPNHMASQVGGHGGSSKYRAPTHPFMHRTQSVDYAIIMSGEIDMLLDDSQVHLKTGDVLVQQGTNHAWVNRGKEVCRIAFVLVDAKDS